MGDVMEQSDDSSASVVPKPEPPAEGYGSTPESSPDGENEAPVQPDAPPVIKRKGGRKPIYATSEERKQRNRQAQAAFRERRTEYIKQLEETIKQQESTLQNLQQSHRNAADECLMLRYKNSLLERLLLEKGIDVQAELRLKGNPSAGPGWTPNPAAASQLTPMQRAVMQRQQHARIPSLARQHNGPSSTSPSVQATSSSQASSPSTGKSPGYMVQGGMSPTSPDMQTQQQMQSRPIAHALPPSTSYMQHPDLSRAPPTPFGAPPTSSPTANHTGFYPSSFQKHYDQLVQEYDAQADMAGVDHEQEPASPDFLPPSFGQPSNPPPPQRPPSQRPPGQHMATGAPPGMPGQPMQRPMMQPQQPHSQGESANNLFMHGPGHHLFDPFDPMLDADPFGLTASMHLPTPFSSEST